MAEMGDLVMYVQVQGRQRSTRLSKDNTVDVLKAHKSIVLIRAA